MPPRQAERTQTRGRARKPRVVHICSFDAVDLPQRGWKGSYEEFRERVLAAGRFSVFEATATQRIAALFTRLCRDPEVVLDKSEGYPWTRVTRAQRAAPKGRTR